MLTEHRFLHKFQGHCFQAYSFLVAGTLPGSPTCLILRYQIPLGLCHKQSIWKRSYKYLWLKTVNLGMFSKALQENATTCFDILSIATAGVYWMTWWSPTKCHIQTVMINMNAHENGIFLSVLIKCLHSSLKCFFHFKSVEFISFQISCFWLSLCKSLKILQLH